MSASGRGGFYGSLHPAYQPFAMNLDAPNTPAPNLVSGVGGPSPALGSTDSRKLDDILSLLHNQQQQITTLASEVSVQAYFTQHKALVLLQVKDMKAKIGGHGKSSRVRVPKDLSVCCYLC